MAEKRYKGVLLTDVDGAWYRWSLFLDMLLGLIQYGILPRAAQLEISNAIGRVGKVRTTSTSPTRFASSSLA